MCAVGRPVHNLAQKHKANFQLGHGNKLEDSTIVLLRRRYTPQDSAIVLRRYGTS